MKQIKAAFVVLALLGVMLMAGQAEDLVEVSFYPAWIDHWENGGALVAVDQAFYEEVGLKVKDLPGGPGLNPLNRMLNDNKIAFATYYDWFVLKANMERGVDLAVVATDFQRPALHLVSHFPIKSKEDLFGKKVEVWTGYDFPLRTFLGQDQKKVDILNQGASMERFFDGQVDASSAMIYNELILVFRHYGIGIENYSPDKTEYETNTGDKIYVYRYGQLNPNLAWNENSLVTERKTLEEHPEVVKKFVHATYKGWRWTMTHSPDEVVEILLRFNSSLDASHEKAGGQKIEGIMIDANVCEYGLGYVDFTAWKPMAEMLYKAGLLESKPTSEDIWSSHYYIPSLVFPPEEFCQ